MRFKLKYISDLFIELKNEGILNMTNIDLIFGINILMNN